MTINPRKILLLFLAGFIIFFSLLFSAGSNECFPPQDAGTFLMSPFGKTEYQYRELIEPDGKKTGLLTLRVKVLMFEDAERIYFDPEKFLIRKTEREINKFWRKEFVTEEYDQEKFLVTVTLFIKGKQQKQDIFQFNQQIYNLILLPVYLSRSNTLDLDTLWQFTARHPGEYRLVAVSEVKLKVPAGRFQAVHYRSIPEKFEIWISKDDPRIPLKIRIKSGFRSTFLLKKHSSCKNPR